MGQCGYCVLGHCLWNSAGLSVGRITVSMLLTEISRAFVVITDNSCVMRMVVAPGTEGSIEIAYSVHEFPLILIPQSTSNAISITLNTLQSECQSIRYQIGKLFSYKVKANQKESIIYTTYKMPSLNVKVSKRGYCNKPHEFSRQECLSLCNHHFCQPPKN